MTLPIFSFMVGSALYSEAADAIFISIGINSRLCVPRYLAQIYVHLTLGLSLDPLYLDPAHWATKVSAGARAGILISPIRSSPTKTFWVGPVRFATCKHCTQ